MALREKQKDFQPDAYEKNCSVFGEIARESDQDPDSRAAYLCYDDQWLQELVFNRPKSDECLDKTEVQNQKIGSVELFFDKNAVWFLALSVQKNVVPK